jgi:two-component system, cell cycle response regulator
MEMTMNGSEVVVVEDDLSIARLIRHALSREGAHVRHAASVAEARRELDEPWDLILLDRRLPDGDGIELCREVRPRNEHGYIIILTGDATAEAKLAGFGCGADDYVTKPFLVDELVARVRAGLRIVTLQKALLASNARLEELSRTDPLTGIANRRAFEEELDERFEIARRYNRPLSLTMIDIDYFKDTNDAYGHQAGDEALRSVARVIRRCSRQSDVVARYGGEEFAVILPETPLFEALQFAEKIRAAVAAEDLGGMPPRVTVSLGIATMGHTMFSTAADLVAAADAALYRAKEKGRNRVECERRQRPRVTMPSSSSPAFSSS